MVEGSDRVFNLKAKSEEESKVWQAQLNSQIQESEGLLRKKTAAGLKKPWKFDNMSEKQFLKNADTGDILLFRCNACLLYTSDAADE